MNNAVIEVSGKQFFVEEGSVIYTEKLDAKDDEIVTFPVLAVNGVPGKPYLKEVIVEGKVLKHGKQKKIVIFKYKAKKKSTRKKQGHRQPYTKVEITDIRAA